MIETPSRARAGRQCARLPMARTGFLGTRNAPALAVAAVLGSGLAPPARADDTQDVTDLGTVVVQARKRDEKILDVPVAVTVQTGEQLREQDAVLFEDIAREVPNLRMMQSPQSVSALDVTMRGQTAIRAAIDYDPAVGIYVDGVYVANGQAAMGTLLDIDTVEVVRGAQGTLFGRNNTGGSISFNTNRPQLGAYSFEVGADTGSFRLFSGHGIVNVPLGDTLALRFAFQDNERDGYGSSVASGQNDFGNMHRYQARMGALWKPNAGFDAYWTYEHFEANEAGALLHPLHGTAVEQLGQAIPQILQADPLLTGIAPVAIPGNFYQTDAGLASHDRSYLDATQLTLTQALNADTRAKVILAYRHVGNNTAIDVDATSLPFADASLMNSSNQKSAELQFSGQTLAHKLDWVGGLYWFRDDGSAPSVIPPPSANYQALFNALNIFGVQSNPGLPPGCLANPNVPPCASVAFSPYSTIESNSVQNGSDAAFVHGEYHLSERWSAAAGVRHTDDTRKLSENAYLASPSGPSCTIIDATTGTPANGGGACPPIDKSVSYSYWSWELSTHYLLSENLNTYFRTGRGQRSGGWNIPVNTVQDQPFHPEELTDYELGFKAVLLGGGLMLSGDVFYGNYDQMQRLLPRLVGGTPTTFVINAGRARVSGAELEPILHLSRSWSLRGSLGYTEARYRDFHYNGADLSGNQFYLTPKLNAGLGLGYETALPTGSLHLHADYAWQDAMQFNVINDFNRQGAYGTLNARAAWAVGYQGDWEIAVFGTNLTNQQYAITGGSVASAPPPTATPPAISWQIPGAPRMVGVGFTFRFGPKG